MTVSYTAEVATCKGLGCFLKLLLRWRASIYKLVWLDLALYLFIYYSLSGIYRFLLDEHQKKVFEAVVAYCNEYIDLIPLSFVLGFYVSIVMTRWWNQYMGIPWPDSIAVYVSATIHGNDERGRLMRRTIARYVCVCLTIVLSNVSPRVKKRFPTWEHFVDAGLLLDNELTIFQHLNEKFPKPSKHWLPIIWASSIVTRARNEGRIRDDFAVKTLIDELNKFRGMCGSISHYDTISVPLVYTQVVTLAVYMYFLTSVIGRQWVQKSNSNSNFDLYFPVFSTLQFFFYMGWLKVAETLINPFGDDDDDFEVNWIIDRNLQVSYLIVDEMHSEHPELIRDQYWDEVFPMELPYTAATEPFREEHPQPSTANIQLSAAQQELQPSSVKIEDLAPDYAKFRLDDADDTASGIHFTARGKLSRSGSRVSSRDRTLSGDSSASNWGSLPRVASVASVLKRLFSREDRPEGGDGKTQGKIPTSSSAISLQTRPTAGASSSMRIGVIEEVDEQMTLTSLKHINENRPHVESIFPQGPPPPSAPVDVPGADRLHRHNIFSRSAPVPERGPITETDSTQPGTSRDARKSLSKQRSVQSVQSIHSGVTYDLATGELSDMNADTPSTTSSSCSSAKSGDEFIKLRSERKKQRHKRKFARSISGQMDAAIQSSSQPSESPLDAQTLLLEELAEASHFSMMRCEKE